jgi:hypothetical protein
MASRPTRRRAGAGARRLSTLPATTTLHAAAAGDRASQPRSGTQIRPAPHLHRPCASVDREEAVAFEPAATPPWRSVEGPDPGRQLLRHGSLPLLREALASSSARRRAAPFRWPRARRDGGPSPFSTAGPALPVATGACGGQAPGGGPSLSLRRRRSTSSRTGRGRGGSFLLPASSSPPARRHPRRTTRNCSSPLRDGAEHQQPAARWGQHERSAHARARCIWGTRHANGTSRALYSPPVRSEKRYMPTGARSSVGRGVPSATSLRPQVR